MKRTGLTLALSVLLIAVAGCNDEDGGPNPSSSTGGAGGGAGSDGAVPPDVPKPGEFLTVEPGGDTICSRGTPFRFFVAGGDPKKIVIDFRGGGACWNAATCSIAQAIFSPEAPTEAEAKAFISTGGTGIYRLTDARNPVNGWTLVHIPYCTGDVHWGDAVVDYSPTLKIYHKGFINVKAVLEWIYARYTPDEIYVTGCSAGAYGAIGHVAYVADHYPNATIRMVADSGCGVVTDNFFKDSFPNWNAQIPRQVEGLKDKDILTLTIVDLYTAIAKQYPNVRFAEQTTAFDKDQTSYYVAMGGAATDWSGKMQKSLADITAAAPTNYRYYMSPGPVHCLQPYDAFYDRETGGVKYVDWLSKFIAGDPTPASAECTATTCKQDPICDSCKAGTRTGGECSWCSEWTGQ